LEDEIQQRVFKSVQQKLAINLIYTSNWLNSCYNELFKNTDLTPQQYNVLRILRGQHPNTCNLKLIKERMLDRMSDASRIVDKLVNKKLVVRTQCPSDRRSVNILISDKGLALLKELDVMEESNKQLFSNLSEKEIAKLNDLLDRLRG
jgi:DNA-binding MarR family transcriptional regulator